MAAFTRTPDESDPLVSGMTVKFLGLEFADEEDRDRALTELQERLDRVNEAEREAWRNLRAGHCSVSIEQAGEKCNCPKDGAAGLVVLCPVHDRPAG